MEVAGVTSCWSLLFVVGGLHFYAVFRHTLHAVKASSKGDDTFSSDPGHTQYLATYLLWYSRQRIVVALPRVVSVPARFGSSERSTGHLHYTHTRPTCCVSAAIIVRVR